MSTLTVFFVLVPAVILSCLQAAPAQSRTLVDAEYYLKDVDRNVPKIRERTAGAAELPPHERQKLLNEIRYAGLKLKNVYDRLAQLSTSDPAVAKVKQRADAHAAELEAAAKKVGEIAKQAEAAAKAAEATIRGDIERVDEISGDLGLTTMLQSHPDRAIVTVQALPAMKQLAADLRKQYAAVLNQPAGRDLQSRLTGFDYRLKGYESAMQQATTMLPTAIERDLAQALQIAELGKQRKSAQPFVAGGIQQAIERANAALALLEAIGGNSATSKALAKQLTTTEKNIAAAQKSLEAEILAENRAPNDLYQGGDRDELLALAKKALVKKHGKQTVLGMRIPMAAWERHSSWRFAMDRFKKEDISELQVALLVKADSKTVHVHYAYLEKDHLAGNKIKVTIPGGEVPLYRRLLLANLD